MSSGRGESRSGSRGVAVDLKTHLSLSSARVGETSLRHLPGSAVAFFVGAFETLLAALFEHAVATTTPHTTHTVRRGFVELCLADAQVALRCGPLAHLLSLLKLREAADAFLDAGSRAAVQRTASEPHAPPTSSSSRPGTASRDGSSSLRGGTARPRSAKADPPPPPPLGPPSPDEGVAVRGGAAGAAWAPGRDDAVARAHTRHLLRRINPSFTLSGSAAAFLAAFAREWFEVVADAAAAAGLAEG